MKVIFLFPGNLETTENFSLQLPRYSHCSIRVILKHCFFFIFSVEYSAHALLRLERTPWYWPAVWAMSIIGSTMSPSTSTLEHLLNKWRKSKRNSKWLFIITDCFTVTVSGFFPLSQLPEKVTLVALMLLLVVRWWKVHYLQSVKNKTISVQQMLIVTGGTGPDGDLASTEVACVGN